jgi:hypothetical protein
LLLSLAAHHNIVTIIPISARFRPLRHLHAPTMESYGPFSNDLNVFDYHGIGELSERGVKVLRRFNGGIQPSAVKSSGSGLCPHNT